MGFTWQFYAAMVLAVIAVFIIIVFLFLLFNPQKNVFDGIKRLFRRRGGGGVIAEKGNNQSRNTMSSNSPLVQSGGQASTPMGRR